MSKSENILQRVVEEVFALTPPDEAIASSREVVVRYLRNNGGTAGTIKWAEFSFSGKLIRSGISQATLMSTRLISDQQDDDLQEMIAISREGNLNAGMLVASVTNEQYYWFVPYTPSDPTEAKVTRLKAIMITEQLIGEIIDLFNDNARLTAAERRIIFQIVIGLHPKEAANADGLSFETKKAQLKNACSKLDCSGQSALMRLMVGQMIHILYMCEAEISHMQVTEKFTSDFLGSEVRISVQRLHNGRLMRFWEMGPADGRPLLMIHGFLFPFVLLNAARELERHKLRLVTPIRCGYLDDQASSAIFYEGRLIDQTIEDITSFVRQTWEHPIPVLGHATGGIFAMIMAQKNPDLFSKIVVASINLLPQNQGNASLSSSFLGGIRKLADDNGIFEWLTKQYLKTTFRNDQTTRFVLRRLFKDCSSDIDALNGTVGSGPCFDWYRRFHATSLLGIPSDFKLMADLAESTVQNINQPVTIIHGEKDAMTKAALVEKLVGTNPQVEMKILRNCGHLVAASHPELYWDKINLALN